MTILTAVTSAANSRAGNKKPACYVLNMHYWGRRNIFFQNSINLGVIKSQHRQACDKKKRLSQCFMFSVIEPSIIKLS